MFCFVLFLRKRSAFHLSRRLHNRTPFYIKIISLNELTIKKLINEDKIVFNPFFCDFSKVGNHNLHSTVQELEHHSSIDILPCDSSQPDISLPYVEETCPGNVGDWWTHLAPGMDDIHTKRIHSISTNKDKNQSKLFMN